MNGANLPLPNSIGSAAARLGKGSNARPMNMANLPRPNSIGSAAAHPGNGSKLHPMNVANLPRPNSIGSAAARRGNASNAHPLNMANLPHPNSIGSAAARAGNGINPSNLHALAATHQGAGNPATLGHPHSGVADNTNTVSNDAQKVGALTQQVSDDTSKLNRTDIPFNNASNQFNAAKSNLSDKKAAEAQAATADTAALNALQKAKQSGSLEKPLLVAQAQLKLTEANGAVALASAATKQAQTGFDSTQLTFIKAAEQKQGAADTLSQDNKSLSQAQGVLATDTTIADQSNGSGQNNPPPGGGGSGSGATIVVAPVAINPGPGVVFGAGPAIVVDPGPAVVVDPGPAVVIDPGVAVVENDPGFAGAAPTVVVPYAARRVRAVAPRPIAQPQGPIALPPPPALVATAPQPPPDDPALDAAAPTDPEFVSVVFQTDVSEADKAAFLDAYKVSIVDGPNADGFVKLQLNEPLPADQLPLFIDSMKQQTAIVANAIAG